MTKLSQSTIEKLQYYVYVLIDPRNGRPFYVGKGFRRRIDQHLLGAKEKGSEAETDKERMIVEIEKTEKVKHLVLRHGLTEKEAFEVESVAIDAIGLKNLTNIVLGHHTPTSEPMTREEIQLLYEAKDAIFEEPAVLININNQYRSDMSPQELYEAARKHWPVDIKKVRAIPIVCITFLGIIREVYEVSKWTSSPSPYNQPPRPRSYFTGKVASPAIRDKYINTSVAHIKSRSQYPIKYVD